ncbi:MAG: alpha/beta hydrolase [Candidatus Aenigmarchaeota archaeon]|nr:alpha/beta hydrolase [Candidatus Aenigmarchaeota archaeon]
MKVMIIPGNGNTDISENWFPYVKKGLEALGIEIIAKNMPDAKLARRKYWIPFIEKNLDGENDAILIGHSSGAVAILRYLETHKILGAVIVGACYTDIELEEEKLSGYFDDEWRWDKIKQNAKWIIQFASTNDPYIPIEEPRFIRDKTGSEYHELENQGHMGADVNKTEFPEIVEIIKRKLDSVKVSK